MDKAVRAVEPGEAGLEVVGTQASRPATRGFGCASTRPTLRAMTRAAASESFTPPAWIPTSAVSRHAWAPMAIRLKSTGRMGLKALPMMPDSCGGFAFRRRLPSHLTAASHGTRQ